MKRKTGEEELCDPQEMDAETEEQVVYSRVGDETGELDFKNVGKSTFLGFYLRYNIPFICCI